MSKPRIYIAGPMRGIEHFNFPAFDVASAELAKRGWDVVGPADLDRDDGCNAMTLTPGDTHNWQKVPANWPNLSIIMERDLAALRTCDAIYMLEGWEDSDGANKEHHEADKQGLALYYWHDGYPDAHALPNPDTLTILAGKIVGDCITTPDQYKPKHPQPVQVLPDDAAERKTYPVYSGLVKYFPDALALVAHHSYIGNQQHNPGQPLHWAKEKSQDELDALLRHVMEGRWVDVAWRALANLQRQVEAGWEPEWEVE